MHKKTEANTQPFCLVNKGLNESRMTCLPVESRDRKPTVCVAQLTYEIRL